MREIKLRYIYKHIDTGQFRTAYKTVDEIEDEDSWQGASPWRLVARDLYIDLEDKNDKEIFEGDIVKLQKELWHDDGFYNAKVVWQKNCGRWAFAIDYKNDDGVLYYGITEVSHIEIMGNVLENPELLEGQS